MLLFPGNTGSGKKRRLASTRKSNNSSNGAVTSNMADGVNLLLIKPERVFRIRRFDAPDGSCNLCSRNSKPLAL
ncbi:hypothetical protein D9M72_549320 [compost metagenome]